MMPVLHVTESNENFIIPFTKSRVVHTCTHGERSVRISQHVTKYYVFSYSKLIEFNLWHGQRMWFRFCFILCLLSLYSLQDRPLLGIRILSTTTSKRMRKYQIQILSFTVYTISKQKDAPSIIRFTTVLFPHSIFQVHNN